MVSRQRYLMMRRGGMKRLALLSGCIMLWALPVVAGGNLPWEKELPFKDATIRYSISGMEQGEEVLYIRDYGKERAKYHETVSNVMGVNMKTSIVEFKTPELIYTYDFESGEGEKGPNPQKYMIEEFEKMSAADKVLIRENAEKMHADYADNMGGGVQENVETMLGYSCDKVEVMGGSVTYLIHGTDVPLKTEMNIMGMKMLAVATSVEEGRVDDKFFRHPEGIQALSDAGMDVMAQNMARQAIAMLKDPQRGSGMIEGMPVMPAMPEDITDDVTAEEEQQKTSNP